MKFHTVFSLVLLQIEFIYSKTYQIESYFPVTKKNNQLLKMTEIITNRCFNKKNFFFLSTNQNSTEDNISILFSSFSTASYLFDTHHESVFKEHERFQSVDVLNETHVGRRNFPMTGVAILIAPDDNLASILLRMKNSIWWNHEAQFLLINIATDGCQQSYDVLQTLWSYNVLSAVYICTDFSSKVSINTYNPYSRTAPKSWNEVQVESLSNGWTMFEFTEEQLLEHFLTSQISNLSLCSILFYDKVKDLENYNLKMAVFNDSKGDRYNEKKSGYERCETPHTKMICMMLEHIGAAVTAKILNSLDIRGEPFDPFRDVKSKLVDVLASRTFFRDSWKKQLYPIDSFHLKIITRKLANQADDKFVLFFKSSFWIHFTICSFSCVIATKYIFQISFLDATFEFLRIFVSMSSLRQPRKFISRIFFIIVLILIFVTSSFFQGHLSAVSTAPDPVSTIDSIGDLIKSNLSVHGFATYKNTIPVAVLRKRFHAYNNPEECTERLLGGDNIACLMSSYYCQYFLSENKVIHISKTNIMETYGSHMFPEESPLLLKFNSMSSRLSEGGFLKFFLELEKLHHVKDLDETDLSNPINFAEFKFIFVVSLGGWMLAILSFFSEIFVYQLKKLLRKHQ